MKTCTAIAALVAAAAFGAAEWVGEDYAPAEWSPSVSNVLFGAVCSNPRGEVGFYAYDEGAALPNDLSVLTDGSVPGDSFSLAEVVGVNGGRMEWRLGAPSDIAEVSFFSRWRDGGRDGMHIRQVAAKAAGGDWKVIAGEGAPEGAAGRGDVGRKDDATSGALRLTLRDSGGGLLAENVEALRVVFEGEQDHWGTGYAEIEANSPVRWTEARGGAALHSTLGVVEREDGTLVVTRPAAFKAVKNAVLAPSQGDCAVLSAGESRMVRPGRGAAVEVRVLELDPKSVVGSVRGMSGLTPAGGVLAGDIAYLGEGAAGADVFVKYGTSPDALDRVLPVACISGTGEFSANAFDVFAPNTTYHAQVVATNGLSDAEWPVGGTFSFCTKPENAGVGLWQRKLDNKGCYGGDVGFHEDVFAAAEGDGEWERHRENGAVMAYRTDEFDSPFSALASEWLDRNRTFLYRGWMYLEAGKYRFVSNFDDYAYFAADGTDIHRVNRYTPNATSEWTCVRTGWHEVAIAVGDNDGGRGPMSQRDGDVNAFHYVFNDDGAKRPFLDPGDGSLFVATAPPGLLLASAARDGAKFCGMLEFGPSVEGARILRCCGETYGGNDTNEWTEVADAGGAVRRGEASRVVAAKDVLDIVAYVRFVAVLPDGSQIWSNSMLWSDIPEIDMSVPRAELASVDGETGGALARVRLLSAGDGESAAVVVECWPADDPSRVTSNEFADVSVGESVFRTHGLPPDRDCFIRVAAKDASGGSAGPSAPVAFRTAKPSAWLPGLWQVRDWRGERPGGWTPEKDVLAVPVGTGDDDRSRVSGAVMAYVQNEFADPVSGLEYSWSRRDYIAFLYDGYMRFRKGRYDFVSAIDDTAYLAIGGREIHVCRGFTKDMRSSWECPADGWYRIRMLVGDYTVDAGPIPGGKAFHYSTDGGASWRAFVDDGKGGVLHVGGATTSTRHWGGGASFGIEVTVDCLPEEFSVYLCSGETDAGFDSPDAWDSKVEIPRGGYAAEGGKVTVDSLSAEGRHYAKLLVEWKTGRAWSDTVVLGAAGD